MAGILAEAEWTGGIPQFVIVGVGVNVGAGPPLDTATWGGNMPVGGIASYSSIASLYANQLDAIFYTNHSFCYVVFGSTDAVINGALVSRNENVVYGTPKLKFNYDCRLLGGKSGIAGEISSATNWKLAAQSA